MNSWREDVHDLRAALEAAAKERHLRARELVDGESAWVRFERSVMHDAVNTRRAQLGKPPATGEQILWAEQSALGHIDYTQKYAIGCADLIHRPEAPAPTEAASQLERGFDAPSQDHTNRSSTTNTKEQS